MRGCLRAILALVLGLQWTTSTGQRIWDNPFESTLRTHQNKAWTLSAGTAMMMGVPSTLRVPSDEPRFHRRAPPGHVAPRNLDHAAEIGMARGRWTPLAAGRSSVGRSLVRVLASESGSTTGEVHRQRERRGGGHDCGLHRESDIDPSVRLALDLDVQSARGCPPALKGSWNSGVACEGRFIWAKQDSGPAHVFRAHAAPQWHVVFTLGVGAGLKIYRGRMVRLTVDVDALQLVQGQQPETTRATDADVRGLNWMQSVTGLGASPCTMTFTEGNPMPAAPRQHEAPPPRRSLIPRR